MGSDLGSAEQSASEQLEQVGRRDALGDGLGSATRSDGLPALGLNCSDGGPDAVHGEQAGVQGVLGFVLPAPLPLICGCVTQVRFNVGQHRRLGAPPEAGDDLVEAEWPADLSEVGDFDLDLEAFAVHEYAVAVEDDEPRVRGVIVHAGSLSGGAAGPEVAEGSGVLGRVST